MQDYKHYQNQHEKITVVIISNKLFVFGIILKTINYWRGGYKRRPINDQQIKTPRFVVNAFQVITAKMNTVHWSEWCEEARSFADSRALA